MLTIGLTGPSGAGKGTLASLFAAYGIPSIDTDAIYHALLVPPSECLRELAERFGDGILFPDGTLDRRALGALVFADDRARAALDGIMQPMLREMILRDIEDAQKNGVSACVLDMPLLYEKDLHGLCDRVWCAYIPRDLQLKRLMERDGFTLEEAEARLRSQLPAKEKAARADVVIDTSGPIQYTKGCVISLYAKEVGIPDGTQSEHPPAAQPTR